MDLPTSKCSPELQEALKRQVTLFHQKEPEVPETDLYLMALAELYETQSGVFDPTHPADELAIILVQAQREEDILEISAVGRDLQEVQIFQKGWESGIAPESKIAGSNQSNQTRNTNDEEKELLEILEIQSSPPQENG
jgi:hypothetical protein